MFGFSFFFDLLFPKLFTDFSTLFLYVCFFCGRKYIYYFAFSRSKKHLNIIFFMSKLKMSQQTYFIIC